MSHNDISAILREALVYVGLEPAKFDEIIYGYSDEYAGSEFDRPYIRRAFLRRVLSR